MARASESSKAISNLLQAPSRAAAALPALLVFERLENHPCAYLLRSSRSPPCSARRDGPNSSTSPSPQRRTRLAAGTTLIGFPFTICHKQAVYAIVEIPDFENVH